MKPQRRMGLFLLVLLGAAAVGWGAPGTIVIQGKLADAAGRPLAGTRAWQVKFFNAASGGTQLGATLTGTAAVGAAGRFSLELTPPAATLTGTGNVYYELAIDSAATPDGAVGPSDVFGGRVKVASALWAQRANGATTATNALALGGVAPGGYATATALTNGLAAKAELNHTHLLQSLDGAVTDDQVPDTITVLHAAQAESADWATSATHADRATTATIAEWALAADYATSSGLADVAFTAIQAMLAWDADNAVTATYADLATTATHAQNAGRLGDVAATDYATKAWVTGQNFATQAWVAMQNFATQAWVMGQGFATQGWVNANVMNIVRASDGPGSMLDADLLDGQQGAFYQNASNINGGTLGTNFYSAYSDLTAEGRIDGAPTNLLSAGGGDGRYWKVGGNAGTTPGTNYLGTSDNTALELKVNGARALRLEPAGGVPNVIGGYSGNRVDSLGGCVAGGGSVSGINAVYDPYGAVGGGLNNRAGTSDVIDQSYATVSGGSNNQAGGMYATIPGGIQNTANGTCSFATGYRANANNNGSVVWSTWNSGVTNSERNDQFLVNAVGGVKMILNGGFWFDFYNAGGNVLNTANGARLTVGGAWTNGSDRASKENFKAVDTQAVLDGVMATSITTWNYKAEKAEVRHMGPVAQDFKAAFGLGDSEKSIATIDADGVALAAIQALGRRNAELAARNKALEERVAALERRMGGKK